MSTSAPPKRGDSIKLIVAEIGARAIVYVPVGAALVFLLGPMTVPALVASAAEPWLNIYVGKLGTYLESPAAPAPIKWILSHGGNALLNKVVGNTWWTRLGPLVPGFIVGAFIPMPAIVTHSVVSHLVGSILGGGVLRTVWDGAVSAALFTTLPLATKVMTSGFTGGLNGFAGALEKIPLPTLNIGALHLDGPALLRSVANELRTIAGLHVEKVVDPFTKARDAFRNVMHDRLTPHDRSVLPTSVPAQTPPAVELTGRGERETRSRLRSLRIHASSPKPPAPEAARPPVRERGGTSSGSRDIS